MGGVAAARLPAPAGPPGLEAGADRLTAAARQTRTIRADGTNTVTVTAGRDR
jgi:hypothetical protein